MNKHSAKRTAEAITLRCPLGHCDFKAVGNTPISKAQVKKWMDDHIREAHPRYSTLRKEVRNAKS